MDIKELKHIAHLTRMELQDKEARALVEDLSKIVVMVDQLNNIELDDDIEMTHQVSGLETVTRADEHKQSFGNTSDELIAASPQHRNRLVVVKKILEHKESN